jgi:hypothetical protein
VAVDTRGTKNPDREKLMPIAKVTAAGIATLEGSSLRIIRLLNAIIVQVVGIPRATAHIQ